MEVSQMTPLELANAAIAAGLEMPGLDTPSRLSPHVYTFGRNGSLDRPASLADVEAAILDALAGRGVIGVWRYANMNAPGYIWWCEYMDGKQLRRASGPTRAEALKAACEALAKEKA